MDSCQCCVTPGSPGCPVLRSTRTLFYGPDTIALPDAVIQRVQEICPEAHIFTNDISRTLDCTLDCPLVAIAWDGKYYLDITMSFASRASSGHVPDIVVAVLEKQAVLAHMYLDNLIVVDSMI